MLPGRFIDRAEQRSQGKTSGPVINKVTQTSQKNGKKDEKIIIFFIFLYGNMIK